VAAALLLTTGVVAIASARQPGALGASPRGLFGLQASELASTDACPNPVLQPKGAACMCTGDSCGSIPEPDLDKVKAGNAMVITSQGGKSFTEFMHTEYVPISVGNLESQKSKGHMELDVSLDTTYQTILGFGGAFTDATAYNYENLEPAAQRQWIGQYFGKQGIGFTVGRVNMNGCDCSRMDYTYDNVTGDYDLEHFCLRDDSAPEVPCGTDYKMTVIKAAQTAAVAAGQSLKLFASSWSAPLWYKDQHFKCELDEAGMYPPGVCMPDPDQDAVACTKVTNWSESGATDADWVSSRPITKSTPQSAKENAQGNCYLTGFLSSDEKAMKSWALYFSKFIDAYKAENISMWGLTVQNEPLATTSLWPSMYETAEIQANFVANYLGPTLREHHPGVKLMIFDDSLPSLKTFAGEILKNEAAAKYVDGVAYHWYGSMVGFYENGPAIPMVKAIVSELAGSGFGRLAHKFADDWLGYTIPSVNGGAYVKDIWATLQQQSADKFVLGSEATNGAILGDKNGLFGPSPGNWGYGYSYAHDVMWSLLNNAGGWTDWNLMLDERGGPNGWGNFLMPTVSYQDKNTFIQQPQLFHLAHFSKYVVPGSKRVQLSITCGATKGEYCQAVAFLTPQGSAVVVITNDEITESPLSKIPVISRLITPALASGEGSALSWTIRCKASTVSGSIPWKAIQTVILPCS